ncbi:S-adenosylmethionine tRNA ribosyltransferase [Diaphorobacter sp.]|uniref:S-adenosylmethionine tRNA ribosyltransferase n=1 Tax=Diaphorobacter sp. TaxID=1934310 RepID=UPI003D0BEE3A
MPHLEGQVLWPGDAPPGDAALVLTVELRDVGRQDAAAPLLARHAIPVAVPLQGGASAFQLDWAGPAVRPGEPAGDLALQARVVDASGTLRYISTEHVAAAPGARVQLRRVD